MKKTILSVAAAISLTMIGCGGSSSSDTNSTEEVKSIGYLIDSEVQGVSYISDMGDSGVTGDDGSFSYTDGANITFKLGELILGTINRVNEDKKVTIPDLIGVDRGDTNNEEVLKIASLLQSLDSDNNPENGITIIDNIDSIVSSSTILNSVDIKSLDLSQIESFIQSDANKNFVSTDIAKAHLDNTLNSISNLATDVVSSSDEVLDTIEDKVENVVDSNIDTSSESIINKVEDSVVEVNSLVVSPIIEVSQDTTSDDKPLDSESTNIDTTELVENSLDISVDTTNYVVNTEEDSNSLDENQSKDDSTTMPPSIPGI